MRVAVAAEATAEGLVARCWVVSDSGAVIDFDERCLIGPNVMLRAGRVGVHAYLVRDPQVALGLQGPLDGRDLWERATPLELELAP